MAESYNFSTPTQADATAMAVAGTATAAKDQAVSLGGAGNKNNLGGEYNVTGNSSLVINGAAGAEAIAQKFTDSLAQINSTASADRATTEQLVATALDKVSALSQSQQTGGISALGQLVLWGLGIAAAVAMVFFWSKSK